MVQAEVPLVGGDRLKALKQKHPTILWYTYVRYKWYVFVYHCLFRRYQNWQNWHSNLQTQPHFMVQSVANPATKYPGRSPQKFSCPALASTVSLLRFSGKTAAFDSSGFFCGQLFLWPSYIKRTLPIIICIYKHLYVTFVHHCLFRPYQNWQNWHSNLQTQPHFMVVGKLGDFDSVLSCLSKLFLDFFGALKFNPTLNSL